MSALPYKETVLQTVCEGAALLAIACEPGAPESAQAQASSKTGVLIIVGGPQYRVGSHRQFTLLARELAGQGVSSLRLDYRGMGDSEGGQRSFEAVSQDIGAALDAWLAQAQGRVERVVLWGLCDGASAALLYCGAKADPRVSGLCLLNPWIRSENSLAKTQIRHYYWQRLSQPAFWKKLLGGGVARSALSDLLGTAKAAFAPQAGQRSQAQAPYPVRMASAWRGFAGPILLIISGKDLTAKEFLDHCKTAPAWAGLLVQSKVSQVEIALADHTFSSHAFSRPVQQHTLDFVRNIAGQH